MSRNSSLNGDAVLNFTYCALVYNCCDKFPLED